MDKICLVDRCNNKEVRRGYCIEHYKQILKYGKITSDEQEDIKNGISLVADTIEDRKERGKGKYINIGKICKAPGCNQWAITKEYCSKHYTQVHKHGRLTPELEKVRNKICKAPNCNNKAIAKSYCGKHYRQVRNHGRLTPELEQTKNKGKVCKIEGCNNKAVAKGYCSKHYQKLRRKGK